MGWQLAGATIMGAGIWSMHFVGMLAYQLPIPMSYDLRITLLSLGFAILACAISLHMATRRRLSWATLAAGGGLMGMGIGSMHYTGMLAMRMEPAIVYDNARVAASVLIACTASSLALWLSFKLKDQQGSGALRKKAIAAAVMGLGVAGMHYTGMSAAYFPSGSICRAALELSLPSVRPSDLAYVIAAFVGAVLVMTTVTANLDASRVRQITRHLRDLGTANRALRDDVIARSTAELEVRRLERFVRSTMDSLLDHICVVDGTGSIVAVNQAWRRFAAENDADPDSVSEGTNYLQVCQVADGEEEPLGADFAALLVAVLEGRMNNAAIEYPCHSPTVSRWFLARITRFQGEGPDCAVVTHEDITASKLSSLAIAAEAERRRVLFEQAVDGIVLLDSKRRVIEANTSFCRMLGRDPETVTSFYPWDWDVLYPTREAFLARWPDLPKQSGTILTRMRRKDGSEFAAEVTHSLAVWGDARVLLCIVRDITEREHAQRIISDNETRYAKIGRAHV